MTLWKNLSVCGIKILTLAITFVRDKDFISGIHIQRKKPLQNDTKINNSVTLTVTFILKIAILDCYHQEHLCFTDTSYYRQFNGESLDYADSPVGDNFLFSFD